jgi:hypothetical protein
VRNQIGGAPNSKPRERQSQCPAQFIKPAYINSSI